MKAVWTLQGNIHYCQDVKVYLLERRCSNNIKLSFSYLDVHGYTPEQRFFFGNVATERGLMRKEAARLRAVSDPHAPSYTRVNGPLVHIEEFYKAFNVTKGDKMYRTLNKRALIW